MKMWIICAINRWEFLVSCSQSFLLHVVLIPFVAKKERNYSNENIGQSNSSEIISCFNNLKSGGKRGGVKRGLTTDVHKSLFKYLLSK
jgi:hypothetical protein